MRATPFALCWLQCVGGTWAYKVVSRHTTGRAALNAAAFPAALGGRLYRVRDERTGSWVGELDGRPPPAPAVPDGVKFVEVK